MAEGLIGKLTNFIMPVEEMGVPETVESERKAHLKVHSPTALRIFAAKPKSFDDVSVYADYLQNKMALAVNFESVDDTTRQRITDFLYGVSYVTGGQAERVGENMLLYVPAQVEIGKELFAYNVPTYVKRP